ncbi:IclR family transcriptional regulator [Rhodococcus koreensis]
MLGTVSKAGKVLGLFTSGLPEWGVSEVASELHIPKSSAHALLSTLNQIGLVRRIPDGRYRLGWRILELNRTLLESTDFLGAARSRTQQIADQLNATIHIAALREHDVIYLDKVTGCRRPEFTASAVGLAAPAHCTALGKVLLANLDEGQADALVERHGLTRCTSRTITSKPQLRAELGAVRLRGCSYDLEESASKICCVAAPIRDTQGVVQAAISISAPASQFRQHPVVLRRSVQRAAMGISRSLFTSEHAVAGAV